MVTKQAWRIGELATATGLTVRALRHYDAVGLVVPERTPAGQRCYHAAHVRRLYGVLALRRLGFPLVQIGEALDEERCSPLAMVRAQLQRLEQEHGARERLRGQLERIAATLERCEAPSVADLLQAIEAIGAMDPEELVTDWLRELNGGGLERLPALLDPDTVWFANERGSGDCRDRGDVLGRLGEVIGEGARFDLVGVEQHGDRLLVGVRDQEGRELWKLVTLREGRVARIDDQRNREEGRRSLAAAREDRRG